VVISAHAWSRGFSVFRAGTTKPVWAVEGPWYENAFVTDGGKKAVLIRQRKGGFDVETWDIATNKPLAVVAADVGRTMALSPDGTTFATSDRKTPTGTLQFVDVATGKLRPQSPEAFTRAAVVWYLPDGTLASADEKASEAVAWNLKTGAMTALPAGTKPPTTVTPGKDFRPPEGTASVVMAADGKHALGYRFDPDELDSVPGDTYLGLFDGTGRVVKKYPRPDQMLGAKYAFAPDGGTFAVARGDGTITFYDTTGAELRTLRHGGGVTSLAYSPDGKFLATACGDGPILVWDVAAKR